MLQAHKKVLFVTFVNKNTIGRSQSFTMEVAMGSSSCLKKSQRVWFVPPTHGSSPTLVSRPLHHFDPPQSQRVDSLVSSVVTVLAAKQEVQQKVDRLRDFRDGKLQVRESFRTTTDPIEAIPVAPTAREFCVFRPEMTLDTSLGPSQGPTPDQFLGDHHIPTSRKWSLSQVFICR